MHYCVLDTSALLQRFQPSNLNSKYLIDTIYQNKKIQLFLPYICFSEVIQQFYSAHKKSQATVTPMSIPERDGLINRLRQDINDGKLFLYPTEASLFARSEEIFNVSFVTPLRPGTRRRYIDMADLLVIATALEFKSLSQDVEDVYVFSSDAHLLDVAIRLRLSAHDPSVVTIDGLPACFDRRIVTRSKVELDTVCKHCDTGDVYGSTKIIDICEFGVCVEQPKRNLNIGERMHLSIPSFARLEEATSRIATAVRIEDSKVGFMFEDPIMFN